MIGSKRLAGVAFVYAISEAFSKGLSFAFFPLLTHLYSSSDFGRISLISTLGALAGIIANFGLTNAAHRYYLDKSSTIIRKRQIVSTGFLLMTLLSVVVVGVFLSFLLLISREHLNGELVKSSVVVLVSVIPAQLVQYCQDIVRLHSTPWKYFFLAVGKTIFGIFFSLMFIVQFNFGLWGYFFGLLCGYLVSLPFAVFVIREELFISANKETGARMLKYSYPFIFAGLGQWLISSSDLFVLGKLREASELGVYSAAMRIATIVVFVTTAFSLAWAPKALRLHAEHADYKNVIGNMLVRIGSLLIYMSAAISFFSREFVVWLTPIEYHSASILVCFLSMSAAISGTVQVTVLGMAFERRSDLIAKAVWICAIAGLVINYTFTWFWGALGTAIANMLAALLLTSIYLYLTQFIHPLTLNLKLIFRMLLLAAIVLVISVFWLQFEIGVGVFLQKSHQ